MPYDKKSQSSILEYAKHLEGKTTRRALSQQSLYGESPVGEQQQTYLGKGGFGNFLEEVYFNKENDSLSEADFVEAKLELKTAPLKPSKKSQYQAKERVVLGMINFHSVIHENFYTSHFLEKNAHILLVFYIHDSLKQHYDLEIKLVDIWNCIQEDQEQIKTDWEYIVNKIRAGNAHKISEGDTLYLGACTKGSTKAASQRSQPNSPEFAHARAFCFKIQYVNHIYKTLLDRNTKQPRELTKIMPTGATSFEEFIIEKFRPFIGLEASEICTQLGIAFRPRAKNFYAVLTKRILGAETHQDIYEIAAADVQIKTIRLEANRKPKESMSFKQIKFTEIIHEKWDDSDLYYTLTSKFIFIIFSHNDSTSPYKLEKIQFWNMPQEDLEIVEKVWLDTQDKIFAGDYENFIRIKDKQIAHVRPKAQNAEDVMVTPQGTKEKKKCFWLNRDYIASVIANPHN